LEHEGIHGLTAAYALDALDERDELEYEEHLRSCERCRDELAALTEAASSLAYAVETPAPPAALRGRILERARAERSNVIPLRTRRWAAPVTTAVAAVAAVVAVAVGLWAFSLRSDLDETQEALDRERDVAAVVSSGDARSLELSGAEGRLVVARDGGAALLVSGLGEAPDARQYEMWVIEGGRPRSAGTFEVEDGRAAVRLGREVSRGSTFAVTLEPDEGGTPGPDGDVLFSVTV
jgi:anti-sigma-K factor RskA